MRQEGGGEAKIGYVRLYIYHLPRKYPKNTNMATQLQKRTFDIEMESIVEGKPLPISKAIKKAGGSDAYAKNPHLMTKSRGWQQLLAKLDDSKYLDRLNEIALDKDKDASLKAIKQIFDLKGYNKQQVDYTIRDKRNEVVVE